MKACIKLQRFYELWNLFCRCVRERDKIIKIQACSLTPVVADPATPEGQRLDFETCSRCQSELGSAKRRIS